MDGKLERLLRRNEKILFEIMKSKIGKKSKVEMFDVYATMVGGICCHLEDKYPFLKEAPKKSASRPASDSDPVDCQKEGKSEDASESN